MIHGTTGSSDNFNSIIETLPNNNQYIVYDLYGRGLSSHPYMEHNIDLYIQQLHEIISKCPNKTFHLIGYSFGGIIAQEYKKKFPEYIKSILLVAPAGIEMNIGVVFEYMCRLPLFILMPIAHITGRYLLKYHLYINNSCDSVRSYQYPVVACSISTVPRKKYKYDKNSIYAIIFGKNDTIVSIPKERISAYTHIVDATHSNILSCKETSTIISNYIHEIVLLHSIS
jgi:pimeloyl-ACP methyl ester carboxylesterase